ncbi:ANTAR domain-containing protein [Streptomyces mirabilis]|uniref:ANTAR domain-containing protein n=1 Tax=Streptomyces mirabilis TaxID=68239 RepID=UPI003327A046
MIHAVDGVDVREGRNLDDVPPDDVSAADQEETTFTLRCEARVMHQVTTPHEDQSLLTAVASARDTALAAEVLELRAINEQLRRALASRAVIDQARGMVMALTPCSSARAWDLLVDVSQHCNVKLRDVAAALVATAKGEALPDRLQRELRRALRRAHAADRR